MSDQNAQTQPDDQASSASTPVTRQQERRLFLFITVVLFPLLAIALVGGFGFAVWISQMIFGPPTA